MPEMSMPARGRVRRVLRSGDPRGTDYLAAQERVREIRSRLSRLRSDLEDLGKIEASFPHDRMCDKVAGTLTLALVALHSLEEKFAARAEVTEALWVDAAADPDGFAIENGESWDWRVPSWRAGAGS